MMLRRFRQNELGAAAVEFAIVAPVLLLFVFGIVDFGRMLALSNRLTSGVREGARAGAVGKDEADVIARAKLKTRTYINSVVAPTNAVTDAEVIVTVNTTGDASSNPDYGAITVTLDKNPNGVGYPFTPITPFTNRFYNGAVTLNPVAVFRWEKAD